MTDPPDDSRAPGFRQFLGEAAVVREWLHGRFTRRAIVGGHRGGGRPVMVIPGFLAEARQKHFEFATRPFVALWSRLSSL